MAVIEAFSYKESLITHIGERLIERAGTNTDLSRYAVIFPGKRPDIYLVNYLSDRLKSSFFPPHIFTITEFMDYAANNNVREIELLDAVYELFNIAKGIDRMIEGHTFKSFEGFVFWGIEIFKVIEEFDAELVEDNNVKSINLPNMPEGIGKLLSRFSSIRNEFHRRLDRMQLTTRGLNYYRAAANIKDKTLDEFEHIYFAGLIALTKAESEVIKTLLKNERASFFTQIESVDDTVTTLKQSLDAELNINSPLNTEPPRIVLYEASDTHEEVESVYSILKDSDSSLIKTAIVLPDAGTLLSLLSNVMDYFPYNYNVTMGYPLKRTPFYTLIDSIFNAQGSRRDDKDYYAKDYLRVLKHPYIKGMHDQIINAIVQQLERYIIDNGKVFLKLEDIENEKLYNYAIDGLNHTEERSISTDTIKSRIKEIHGLFFKPFEPDRLAVRDFADSLDNVIQSILNNSHAIQYKFSPSFIKGLMDIIEILRHSGFKEEQFEKQRIFTMFNSYVEMQTIPFNGIPLTGLQILGLLETRILNFDRVVLLDCNEGVIPSVSKYEPLLPFQVKKALKLPTYTEREHVFRYHFRRLIKGAKEVYLIYRKTEDAEKSRFIEEIIWEEEKQKNKLVVLKNDNKDELIGRIRFVKKQFKTEIKDQSKAKIKKDRVIMDVVAGIMAQGLSPSAIDTYMNCPVRFYYKYVLGLKEPEELGEDIEAKNIGSFIHGVLKDFYEKFKHGVYTYNDASEEELAGLIDGSFNKAFNGEDNGEYFLLKAIIKKLLSDFIKKDFNKKPYILELETKKCADFPINGRNIKLKGFIDRIDKRADEIFIVDYKTGSKVPIPGITKLLEINNPITDRATMKGLIKSFQLPVYLYMYKSSAASVNYDRLNASLYMVKENKEHVLFTKGNKENIMKNILIPSLQNVIMEILNQDIPFERDNTDKAFCSSCPFASMCGSVL